MGELFRDKGQETQAEVATMRKNTINEYKYS